MDAVCLRRPIPARGSRRPEPRRVAGVLCAVLALVLIAAPASAEGTQYRLTGGGTVLPYLELHASLWARPVLLPNLSGRLGVLYGRDYGGNWSVIGGDVWGLYELELGMFSRDAGTWLGAISPYVGAGLDALQVNVGSRSFLGAGLYGVAGGRYNLGGNLWAWAEVRLRLFQLLGERGGVYDQGAISTSAGVGFDL